MTKDELRAWRDRCGFKTRAEAAAALAISIDHLDGMICGSRKIMPWTARTMSLIEETRELRRMIEVRNDRIASLEAARSGMRIIGDIRQFTA